MQFYDLYHQSSKQLSKDIKKPEPSSSWPEDWKITYIKKYERFPFIRLPKPLTIQKDLFEALIERKSGRKFGNAVSEEDLSTLLYYSLGEIDASANNDKGRRTYASGGARFPLEAYVIVFETIGTILPAIYHYNVDDHTLSLIYNKKVDGPLIQKMVEYDFLLNAKCAIALTGVLSRSFSKYKEHAYRYALIESGEVAQNLALISVPLHIDTVNIGVLSADIIEDLLDIDGTDEIFVHSVFIG